MDGIALARSIEVRRPQIRVLYMSGYAPGGAPGAGHVLSETDHYIQKPLALGALAAAVRRALGEGGAASG
jgi:DNA-binding NtrC family response regulator